MTTTKTTMEPLLKEKTGKGVVTQANKTTVAGKPRRLCGRCGRFRLGPYCRECGERTDEEGKS